MPKKSNRRVQVKRRRGCLTGCLPRLLALLGLAALLFVAAHVLGLVGRDAEGRPTLTISPDGLPGLSNLADGVAFAALDGLPALQKGLPGWAYGLDASGLTVKTLRAGQGQAVLVCADGYTLLVGGGSGRFGAGLQMLLCGVNRLDAAIAPDTADEMSRGLAFAMQLGKPGYFFYQDSQVKTDALNAALKSAGQAQPIVPFPPLAFTLGRARVRFIGPLMTHHQDERDDSLSLVIEYGNTRVLLLGGGTAEGERELTDANVIPQADAVITPYADADQLSATFLEAATPTMLLCTGSLHFAPRERLRQSGVDCYTAAEYGVMTLRSDGQMLVIEP